MISLDYKVIGNNEAGIACVSGNGAVGRALIESNVQYITSYPGTPCAEAVENLFHLSQKFNFLIEWSINEKIAFEKAFAAAMVNMRSAFITKSVGMNTILDSLLPACYAGINGGMVIISADDPGAYNSPIEEDTRFFARYANILGFAPSNVQEIKDIIIESLYLSEMIHLPVLVVISGSLLYSRQKIILREINISNKRKPHFERDLNRWFIAGKIAVRRHQWLIGQQNLIDNISENSDFNKIDVVKTSIGIIVSGASYGFVKEILKRNNLEDKFSIAKISSFYPIPKRRLKEFIKSLKEIIVFEELEPFIEEQIRILISDLGLDIKIFGKLNNYVPRYGDLNWEIIKQVIFDTYYRLERNHNMLKSSLVSEPAAYITFCAGCPHRKSLFILKKALSKLCNNDNRNFIIATDIGCYALGAFSPLNIGDVLFCMGTSINISTALSQVFNDKYIIGIMGDSTFLHSGIQGLLDSKYRKSNIFFYILDNYTCAMTGQQTTPGTNNKKLLPNLIKSLGIRRIVTINPSRYQKSYKIILKYLRINGLKVVISKDPCVQYVSRNRLFSVQKIKYHIDKKICKQCGICAQQFGCPAIKRENDGYSLITGLCNNCGSCYQICPYKAVRKRNGATKSLF